MLAWLLVLPIMLFAQSSSTPSKSVTVDNTVPTIKGTKDNASKKSQGAPQVPPTTIAAPVQVGPYIAQQPAEPSPTNKPSEVTPDPIVRYTFWLVIVGILQFAPLIIQAFFLYKAFRETTAATAVTAQSLKEAQRSNSANEALTLESNTNARISADAAKGALTLGQNAERSWLLFQAANLLQPLQVGRPILAEFIFKNTGKTPALGIRAGANFYIWEGTGEPDPVIYFDPQFPRRDIGAGELWVGQANRREDLAQQIVTLSAEELSELMPSPTNKPPKKVLFFIGAIEYIDVFQLPISKDTIPHYSNFCAQFLIDARGGGMFVPAKCRIQIR